MSHHSTERDQDAYAPVAVNAARTLIRAAHLRPDVPALASEVGRDEAGELTWYWLRVGKLRLELAEDVPGAMAWAEAEDVSESDDPSPRWQQFGYDSGSTAQARAALDLFILNALRALS
jgi:hypothetical protein